MENASSHQNSQGALEQGPDPEHCLLGAVACLAAPSLIMLTS